ncbi:hypothetical protein LX69_01584 [Breznakibacter xylanolyticus]|uniref:Uncharacterized protein n=1 Tax=Breznakibacter xylanolyticus TaxID=990 RepID=A0A2W7Q6A3_9BACT|nr:hypothetical protein LX69_01584 [Breznakibacter xylanolyticus]
MTSYVKIEHLLLIWEKHSSLKNQVSSNLNQLGLINHLNQLP